MSEAVSAASAFDAAVAAVRAGADPAGEAGKLYEELTEAERLGLLDGDVPFWEGLAEMRQARYGSRPHVHGAVARLGIPGIRFPPSHSRSAPTRTTRPR
jgi:beta-glucosidase